MSIPKIRKINGHARFIFVYRDVKTTMFIMLDDGRVFMETFNSRLKKAASSVKTKSIISDQTAWLTTEKIKTFNNKMSKYLIDERTDIVYTSDWEHYQDPKHNTDIIFNLLDTIRQYSNSSFRYVDIGYIILGIKHSFKSNEIIPASAEKKLREKFIQTKRNLRSFCVISRYINTSYEYIFKRKLCHWISEEFNEQINLMSRATTQRFKILSVGLFYLCVKAWNRDNIRKTCGYDQSHKNYILKDIKIIED